LKSEDEDKSVSVNKVKIKKKKIIRKPKEKQVVDEEISPQVDFVDEVKEEEKRPDEMLPEVTANESMVSELEIPLRFTTEVEKEKGLQVTEVQFEEQEEVEKVAEEEEEKIQEEEEEEMKELPDKEGTTKIVRKKKIIKKIKKKKGEPDEIIPTEEEVVEKNL